MSIAETKAALASAIGTVSGLKGYASKPRTLKQGDAFVRWRGWARGDGPAGSSFFSVFSVIVVLPQSGEEAADDFAYDKADLIEAALMPVMFIDTIEPTNLPADDGGDMYTLTVTGRAE